jgi:hypothetical protein
MRVLAAIVLCMPGVIAAQTVLPLARLDTGVIRIGEQARITLGVEFPPDHIGREVGWPEVGTHLAPHVEVLHSSEVDTVLQEHGQELHTVQLVRVLTITSFDTGYWAIPPFSFTVSGRPAETAPMLLEVRGVELDTAMAVHDLKPFHELPFSLGFWLRQNWYWPTGGALLALLIGLLVRKLRHRERPSTSVAIVEEVLPLHERVRNALLALEQERLWQQGLHKEYHSRITDLLRGYIEERFQVQALERTTDELLHALKVSPLAPDQRARLANMLQLADMVKFAKAVPTPPENEGMMAAALRFVHETADRRAFMDQSTTTEPVVPGTASHA